MDGYVSKPIIAAVFFAEIARVLDKLSFHDPNARAATEVVSVPDRRTPAHIDREALLERVEGDAALLAQMLEIFEVEGDRLVAVMEAAVGSGDASSLERAAHTLKGMVANFTADAAANAASHLEEMGRTGRLQGAEDLLHELAQEVTALRALLSELCTEAAR
jgi:HPt (histidine-containing phosphotransfer) domain-containing protein